MDPLLVPLAYSYVAISLMLTQVNDAACRLQLRANLPITEQSLHGHYLCRPLVTGFCGALETDKFAFYFNKTGILYQIVRINVFTNSLPEQQLELSRIPSPIDTNQAYNLATNWLAAMLIDVGALERKYPPVVEQRFFYDRRDQSKTGKARRKVLLPIFHVRWGAPIEPAVMVSIFGPTKELLRFWENDVTFSRYPPWTTNATKLTAISDVEFGNYTPEQKEALIKRFTPIEFSRPEGANSKIPGPSGH